MNWAEQQQQIQNAVLEASEIPSKIVEIQAALAELNAVVDVLILSGLDAPLEP